PDRRRRQRDRRSLRRLRDLQGCALKGSRGPVRERLGLGLPVRRQARRQGLPQPGQPDHGGRRAGLRHRRLGARLLPQVSEQASELRRSMVEHGELERHQPASGGRPSSSEVRGRKRGQRRGASGALLARLTPSMGKIRNALVIMEVAVAILLMAGGLLQTPKAARFGGAIWGGGGGGGGGGRRLRAP